MVSPLFKRFILFIAISTSFLASVAYAELWMDVGDERSRHHLQVLSDAGLVNLPLSNWPLMWRGVRRELMAIDATVLNDLEARSYQHLLREMKRADQEVSGGQFINAGTTFPGLVDYSSDSREQLESRTHLSYTSGNWSAKLQGSVVGDTIDGHRYRADGSYVAGLWGNWAVGVGAIDRWWGPGWQSSIILSNAARPTPGVFINRLDSKAFDLPILEWLGPWDLRFFVNQKEGSRATPRAKLLGMRVGFKPFEPLEIGLSRTAQWGGEGRPEDFRSIWKTIVGQTNRGADGIAEDGSDEPANQLAGYDWRLSHLVRGLPSAFYGQLIGEDEAGGFPYKFLGMIGLETSFMWGEAHSRLALEVSNTTMEFDKGGTPNTAYEHPRYPSGYRYRGRPLGASIDNDSELVVLKGFHNFAQGHRFNWSLGRGRINYDDTTRAGSYAGNVFGDNAIDLWYATAQYAFPITDASHISIAGQFYDNDLEIGDQTVSTGAFVTYELRLWD